MEIRRTAETWIGVGAVAAFALVATLAGAGLVPGGGPSKSDCYSELNVQGVDASGVTNDKKITCKDGDPCDAGPCGDNSCTFKVELCWNQTNVSGCTAPASLDSIVVKKLAATVPSDLSGSSCTGSFVDLTVATKKNGKKPGKANVKTLAKAPKGTKPHADADAYQFVCTPRPSTEPCSPSGAFID